MARISPPRAKAPAGKHPTLRPKATGRAIASKITKQARAAKQSQKEAAARSRNPRPWQAATRRILTRSQTKVFRLLDLPAEMRNEVYQYAATSLGHEGKIIDLKDLAIPPELSLSKQYRTEALPFYFSTNHFKFRVISNYCVFRRHFHHHEHVRYHQAGIAALSPLLTDIQIKKEEGEAVRLLKDEQIRFKRVTVHLDCVCCDPGKLVAKFELSMQGTQPVVECEIVYNIKDADRVTKPSMELIFESVRKVVGEMGQREGFNGFTVGDLKAVAAFASHGGDKDHGLGRGYGH